MKKIYAKPNIEITNIEIEQLIATSSIYTYQQEGESQSDYIPKRHSTWGDLWNEGK